MQEPVSEAMSKLKRVNYIDEIKMKMAEQRNYL